MRCVDTVLQRRQIEMELKNSFTVYGDNEVFQLCVQPVTSEMGPQADRHEIYRVHSPMCC